MPQTRKKSLLEQLTNTGIKFFTAMAIFELGRDWLHAQHSAVVTFIFTINSIVFGYSIRRLFNWLEVGQHTKNPDEMATDTIRISDKMSESDESLLRHKRAIRNFEEVVDRVNGGSDA